MMEGKLKTIRLKDYKGDPMTVYEMDITFSHVHHNYTYFSLEGETKQGFTERISYEIRKMYGGATLVWTE